MPLYPDDIADPIDLVCAFPMNEGVGSKIYDIGPHRMYGGITGAVWTPDGRGLDFNPATPSYVTIPAAYTQLDFTSEDFSIIARIYVDDLTSARYLFTSGRWQRDGYQFWLDTNGRVLFDTSQNLANQTSACPNNSVATGSWFTVGVSRDGASVKLLVNGVDVTNLFGVHVDPLASARDRRIGTRYDGATNPFDGKIEFLRIFKRALSEEEHMIVHLGGRLAPMIA